ncbi:MAG: anti-sigma factor [Ornithinimicrobium sp.]
MTTPTPHADDLIAAYALNAVDDDERRLVEEHLSDCAACREELALYVQAAVHLTGGQDVAPPASVRAAVLGTIAEQVEGPSGRAGGRADGDSSATPDDVAELAPARSERRRPLAALWGLAAAGVIAVGGFAVWQNGDLSPVEQVVQAEDAQRVEATYEGETLAVVSSADLDQSVLLSDDLPALSEGEVYQAWWVDADGVITSAGVIDGEADPDAVEMPLEGQPDQPAALALSVEPTGGSEQPTTDPLLAIELG